MIKLKRK